MTADMVSRVRLAARLEMRENAAAMSDFDVITPTYNAGASLAASISSALACGARRVIVVDDGSEPPAAAPDDDRVMLSRQENAGPSAARNRALEMVTSPWIVLLDADDVLLEGIGSAISLGESLSAVAVVSGWVAVRGDQDATNGERRRPPEAWCDRALPRADDVFRPINLFKGSGMVVHRRVIDGGVRFDESLRLGEDREFLRRAGELGSIAVCDVPVIAYREHENDGGNLTSARHFDRRVRDFLRIVDRWHSGRSDEHFRASATWLLNQLSKRDADEATWSMLLEAFRRYGWRAPVKPRLRRLARLRRG